MILRGIAGLVATVLLWTAVVTVFNVPAFLLPGPLEVADRVVIMDKGRIIQEGAPDVVYEHPATPFVFEFLGNVNLFHSRIDRGFATVAGARFMAPAADSRSGWSRNPPPAGRSRPGSPACSAHPPSR